MARARNDFDGWTRGLGHYSEASTKLYRPDLNKPKRFVPEKVFDDSQGMDKSFTGRTGPVSKGGPPRYRPKTAAFSEAKGNGGQRVKGK